MASSSPFTPAERLESLKGALLGGAVALIVNLGWLGLYRWSAAGLPLAWGAAFSWHFSPALGLATLIGLISSAIAALSGALFALTYRYAIRQETNPQLKGGVVLAFTLVRSLAQVDAASAIAQHYGPFAIAGVQSLVLFGLTGLALDWALQRQWVRPFKS